MAPEAVIARYLPLRTAFLCALAVAALAAPLQTLALDYGLKAEEVADGVWVFRGDSGHFNRRNGGNILNTGFIETDDGAVVIDPGPTRLYGEQMRKAVEATTGSAVARVYVTHRHPDHFLGAQAFEGIPVYALPDTIRQIEQDGPALLDGLYRLLGDWMRGTDFTVPSRAVEAGSVTVGGRELTLLALSGHSGHDEESADLVILDVATGVLFAGDLVFHRRAPTTPHATLTAWHDALDALEALKPALIVPGHGPLAPDAAAIDATRAWLQWLESSFVQAAEAGLSMGEATQLPVADAFAEWSRAREELVRSVNHLYPAISSETLRWNTESGAPHR